MPGTEAHSAKAWAIRGHGVTIAMSSITDSVGIGDHVPALAALGRTTVRRRPCHYSRCWPAGCLRSRRLIPSSAITIRLGRPYNYHSTCSNMPPILLASIVRWAGFKDARRADHSPYLYHVLLRLRQWRVGQLHPAPLFLGGHKSFRSEAVPRLDRRPNWGAIVGRRTRAGGDVRSVGPPASAEHALPPRLKSRPWLLQADWCA